MKYENLFTSKGKIFFPPKGSIIPVGTIVKQGNEFKITKITYVADVVVEKGYDSNFKYQVLKPLNKE
jgi:hypothetical protein